MHVENTLFQWHTGQLSRRLVKRERRTVTGMIQVTLLVHHVLVKHRREVDNLVRILFTSDSRIAGGQVRKSGITQFAPDEALDSEAPGENVALRNTHSVLLSSAETLEILHSSPSMRVNVTRPSTR